jgi:hypothetical protein
MTHIQGVTKSDIFWFKPKFNNVFLIPDTNLFNHLKFKNSSFP